MNIKSKLKEFDKKFWNNGLFDYDDTRAVNKHRNVYSEIKSFIKKAYREGRKETANEIWFKVVEDMVFLLVSDYSGCEPHDNLIEAQRNLYFRLIKERLNKQLSKDEK